MSQQEPQIKDISHSIGDINFQLPILLDSEKRVRMRMVGDVFTIQFEGKEVKLTVVPESSCRGCFFESMFCPDLDCSRLAGRCSVPLRWDGTPVIFKEIPQNEEA